MIRWHATQVVRLAAPLACLLVIACNGSSQTRYARFLESGKKYQEARDYARAILQFKNAARSRPSDPEPYYRLGLAYLDTGDARAAVAHLQKAGELNPKFVPAQLKLAELMAVDRSPEIVREAQKRAQMVLVLAPEDPDALSTLALAELRLGQNENAEQHLLRALERFPQHLKSSVTLATLKLSRREWDEAEAVLKAAVARAPQSVEPLLALGRFYTMRKNLPEAEKQLRLAVSLNPEHSFALLDLGAVQFQSGNREQAAETYRRLSHIRDKAFRPWYGIFLFHTGQHHAAIAEFDRLAKEDPKDRAARTRLVSAYVLTKRTEEAERVLSTVLKKNPKDADALIQRAEIYLMGRKHAEAQTDLNQVLRFRPDSALAHFFLARVHRARGSPLNERQELTEALRLDPNLIQARLELARSLLQARSPKAALDLMNQTPEAQRKLIPVVVQRNWVLLALGSLDELRRGIEDGLAVVKAPDLLLQDALLRLQQGDHAGARSALEAALERKPEDTRLLETLAQSYVTQKQNAAWLERLRRHAAEHPKSAQIQHFLGRYHLGENRRQQAREAFTQARVLSPDFMPAEMALAEMDMQDGELDASRRRLAALLAADSSNLAARLLSALVEERAGNYSAAVEHYRQVADADPANVVALNNLAYRLANDLNQPDEALQLAQKAKELAPENVSVDDTIGWAFYRKGLYRTAVSYLEKAAAKEPKALYRYHLGLAYWRAGEVKNGRQTLEAALRLDPNLPEASQARQALTELAR
jgi:tetratricopeptide (TPR) repeat protein